MYYLIYDKSSLNHRPIENRTYNIVPIGINNKHLIRTLQMRCIII